MTSSRRKAVVTGRPDGVSQTLWDWLLDVRRWPPEVFFADEQALWRKYRRLVLAEWSVRHPGTRPRLWWRYDAPEPRRQIGGSGRPAWEHAPAIAPHYLMGIPAQMVDVDPDDPPVFETERDYLERIGAKP